jgi:hypothetical protein
VTLDKTFPKGVYSFSAIVESEDTDSPMCLFSFTLNNESKKVVSVSKSVGNQRVSVQNIQIPTEFNGICFYASISNASAIGDEAVIRDIQLEAGAVATEYKPYFNCNEQAVISSGKNLCRATDIECIPDSEKGGVSERSVALEYTLPATAYSLSSIVESTDIDSDKCMVRFKYTDGEAEPRTVGSCLLGRSVNGDRVKVENVAVEEPFNMITFSPSSSTSSSVGDTASFRSFQLEFGSNATEYQSYIAFESAISDESGCVDALQSKYPATNIFTSDNGAVIEVTYNRDINKVIEAVENALFS